jgi:hypothetical protein
MAFTNAPATSTYSSQKISLAQPLRLRNGNNNAYPLSLNYGQDAGMVNALLTKIPNTEDFGAVTRPAINANAIGAALTENGLVRGTYVWEKSPGTVYYYIVCDTKIYTTTDPASAANWTHVNSITSQTTPVRFCEFIDTSTNAKSLVMVDGVVGYVFVSNVAGTQITDVDFPNPHVPFPVYLDGYLFLAKEGTGDIYNSNLNDPTAWTAGDFISSEIYPDDITAILKVNNYLLAVGKQGCEYFNDVGNPSGSPLARYEGGVLPFGCQIPNSIATTKDLVVMIANNNDGQSTLKLIDGFKYKDMDSSFIIEALNDRLQFNWGVTDLLTSEVRGYLFRHYGELYYGLLFDGAHPAGQFASLAFSNSYAFSFNTNSWVELQWGNDTSRLSRFTFPVTCTAGSTTGNLDTYCAGNVGNSSIAFFGTLSTGGTPGGPRLAIDEVSNVSEEPVYQEFRTPNIDFGTLNRKAMSRLGLNVELGDSSSSTLTKFYVMWNDADYVLGAWQGPRELNLYQNVYYDFSPFITQLGQFRRRALLVYNTDGTILRNPHVEVDINKGKA